MSVSILQNSSHAILEICWEKFGDRFLLPFPSSRSIRTSRKGVDLLFLALNKLYKIYNVKYLHSSGFPISLDKHLLLLSLIYSSAEMVCGGSRHNAISDNRLERSPEPVLDTHWFRGKIQRCCNQCHNHSCSHCCWSHRLTFADIYGKDSTHWSANFHRHLAA